MQARTGRVQRAEPPDQGEPSPSSMSARLLPYAPPLTPSTPMALYCVLSPFRRRRINFHTFRLLCQLKKAKSENFVGCGDFASTPRVHRARTAQIRGSYRTHGLNPKRTNPLSYTASPKSANFPFPVCITEHLRIGKAGRVIHLPRLGRSGRIVVPSTPLRKKKRPPIDSLCHSGGKGSLNPLVRRMLKDGAERWIDGEGLHISCVFGP